MTDKPEKKFSLLILADKLRIRLDKLEAKKRERLAEVAADYDHKIKREKELAGSDVVCLLESAGNLAKDAAE